MQDLKILALQSDLTWENPQANRENIFRKIENAFNHHHLVVIPETFTTGFPVNPVRFAEKLNGKTIQWMSEIARNFKTSICGSLLIDNGDSYTNTLIFMHSDGTFDRYDKRHVFSMGGEHERIKQGNKQLIVELNGWKIKPMVCYDLRFPVWSKNRYENRQYEYDLAIYVANWPAVRSYPWTVLLTARAIENMSYVLGVNRIGYDGQGYFYNGNTRLIDFKGNIVKACSENSDCILEASLSFTKLQRFRDKFNVGNDWDGFKIY